MKKYIQPKIEIDTLETKDIILLSDLFNIIGGNTNPGNDVSYEETTESNGDKSAGVNVGVGILKP